MHVLSLPSFYPTPILPNNGSFFKSYFQAMQRMGITVGVVYYEALALRRDLKLQNVLNYHFQTTCREEDGLLTFRRFGWDTLSKVTVGGRLFAHLIAGTVRAYIKQVGRPDLLHAHQVMWGGYAAYLVSRSLHIPYVITEHSHYFLQPGCTHIKPACRSLYREAYLHAGRVIAVSHALANVLRPFIEPAQVQVIPNLVDMDFFQPDLRPVRDEIYRFVAIGRLVEEKRFDLLLRAFARLVCREDAVQLTIVGEGPERKTLQALCQYLGIQTHVLLPGEMPRHAIHRLLCGANALVLSSEIETFGVVLLEALSMGLPVVATACGGPEDIVTEEVGILVPPGDDAALAEAMHRLSHTPYSSACIREYARQRFSAEVVAQQLHRVYEEVLRNCPRETQGQ